MLLDEKNDSEETVSNKRRINTFINANNFFLGCKNPRGEIINEIEEEIRKDLITLYQVFQLKRYIIRKFTMSNPISLDYPPIDIQSYTLPMNITHIADNFFENCSLLQSIEIPQSLKNIPIPCFSKCTSFSSIIFHGQIESIGSSCFSGCSKLQSIDFRQSIKNLPNCCFSECSSLSSIILCGQIESIGQSCFSKCSKLQSIDFRQS
jgi:hypothetical protein